MMNADDENDHDKNTDDDNADSSSTETTHGAVECTLNVSSE